MPLAEVMGFHLGTFGLLIFFDGLMLGLAMMLVYFFLRGFAFDNPSEIGSKLVWRLFAYLCCTYLLLSICALPRSWQAEILPNPLAIATTGVFFIGLAVGLFWWVVRAIRSLFRKFMLPHHTAANQRDNS
ncbi:MAG: hypothetical protein HOP09_02450 [Hyphomicrobium sp.]|nr:hypothetical protein [Hyphomicrobium sp.]